MKPHVLERKRRAARRRRAELRREGRARDFYCRRQPCFICDSFLACCHREGSIMTMPVDVLMREARADRGQREASKRG